MTTAAATRPRILFAGTSINFPLNTAAKAYETAGNTAYGVGPISFGAWIQRTPDTTANPMTIIGKGKSTAANLAWALQVMTLGTIRLDVSSTGATETALISTGTIDAASWHHVAAVYNPTGTVATIYVDGVSFATTASAAASLFVAVTPMPVTVGATSAAVGTMAFPFHGRIQEAFVTNQVLTAAQLVNIMAYGAAVTIPLTGTTTSIWITGVDVLMNATGTDFGNANSPLTLTGLSTAIDCYGRITPRLQANGYSTMPMLAPAGIGSTVVSDGTDGWNAVARSTDLALLSWTQQANNASITAGTHSYYYGTYDSANAGGSTPAAIDDMAAAVPSAAGVTTVGYNNEGDGRTATVETNTPSPYQQNYARDAKNRGYTFMSVPLISYLIASPASWVNAVDTGGNLIVDYLIIQAQQYCWSVDVFCLNIFPVLKAVYAAHPRCRIVLQMQPITASSNKGCDHTDMHEHVANCDNYLKSLGGPGLWGWCVYVNVPLLRQWGQTRTQLRPVARTGSALTGTATAGAATTLTDSGQTWYVNRFQNVDGVGTTTQPYRIYLTGGTGQGQSRNIASNTATAITVASSWTTNPDTTTKYTILRPLRA